MNTQFVSHVVDENIDGSREGEKGECGGSRWREESMRVCHAAEEGEGRGLG